MLISPEEAFSPNICWADWSPMSNEQIAMAEPVTDEGDDRTTLMFRNLPDGWGVDKFLALLDAQGFALAYDFAYMPAEFQNWSPMGYVFVNFTSTCSAQRARRFFTGFCHWGEEGDAFRAVRACDVLWSNAQQGAAANIERYRNSSVMHRSVADEHKPRLFVEGRRVAFPAPTENIRPPKFRRRTIRPSGGQ